MKRTVIFLVLLSLVLVTLPTLGQTGTGVSAEAVGQANLRAATDVESALLGQIVTGTRYPVVGRSAQFPWLLLGDPVTGQPIGWVYTDLLTVQGDVNGLPAMTLTLDAAETTPALVSPAPAGGLVDTLPTLTLSAAPEEATAGATTTLAAPTPTVPAASVTGTVLGEINLRYAPGTEYSRVGLARAGDQLVITGYHTQLPWVRVQWDEAPNGEAWVAVDLLEIQGDVYTTDGVSRTQFNLPTLTPTASVVQSAAPPGGTPVAVSPAFQALGDQLWQLMLDRQFEIGTSRLGALYLQDLQTGEAVTFGSDIAFSGMSLNKIGVLAALYGTLDAPPDDALAVTIAEAMICSENISSNELLSEVGGGSPFTGALAVTEFYQRLGLEKTFITAPYANDPFITPEPAPALTTRADQTSAQPDPFNQATVDELGGVLSSVYECAYRERGPLIDNFDGAYTPLECRQMLHTMSNNRINALFETGVPLETRIAHKHGWVDDTHGDAAVIFTPGGDYVMVAVVYNPTWMDYSDSFPLLGELSRTVYNYYNPTQPVEAIRDGDGAEQCELLGNPLLQDLTSSTFSG